MTNISASTIVADECLVSIVGNIANVSDFPHKLKGWCGAHEYKASNISIFHGNKWSCDVYAGLIIRLQHQDSVTHLFRDDATVEKYAQDLTKSGITDVSNCILFFNFTKKNEFKFQINYEPDLWGNLAINDQSAKLLKDKIIQYLQ